MKKPGNKNYVQIDGENVNKCTQAEMLSGKTTVNVGLASAQTFLQHFEIQGMGCLNMSLDIKSGFPTDISVQNNSQHLIISGATLNIVVIS